MKKTVIILVLCVLTGIGYGYCVRYRMERRYKRAKIARNLGRTDRAIEELAYIPKIATLEKHTLPYVWFRGDAYKALGRSKPAFADFRQAYIENPNHLFVLLSFGEALFYAGHENVALWIYQKALTIRPSNPEALESIKAIRRKQ